MLAAFVTLALVAAVLAIVGMAVPRRFEDLLFAAAGVCGTIAAVLLAWLFIL